MRSVNEDRLQKTLEYILEYQKRESKAPTYRQIQKECGYNSLGTVAADVARLKKRHLIESSDEGGWNSIKLPSRLSVEDKHNCFICGAVPCGQPSPAIEDIEAISTFDFDVEYFTCGVYRGTNGEIVETEKFALMFYCSADKTVLGAKLYMGYENKKHLVAICERYQLDEKTEYAYCLEDSDPDTAITNSERIASQLGAAYDSNIKKPMRLLESFAVDHSGATLPTVKAAGIPKCLTLWRMADSYIARRDNFNFFLCTGKTEYIFSIKPKDVNIYCGASYNIVFDLGIFGGGQFFRIRNYKDNSEKWCRFTCDFSYEARKINIPTEQCELGKCIETSKGLMWCVKRYTDDEIVVQGCGDDEHTYRRTDKRTEQFISGSK